MIGKVREYMTGEKRRRVLIVLLLLLALLGVGIGSFPVGEDPRPAPVELEEVNGEDVPDDDPVEDGTGPNDNDNNNGGEAESASGDSADGGSNDGAEISGSDQGGDSVSSFQSSSQTVTIQQSSSHMDIIVNKTEMNGQVDNVMPGDSGNVTLNVTNNGTDNGTFRVITSNVTDFENGLTEPEAEVDTGGDPGQGDGELASNLLVRWSLNSSSDNVTLTNNYETLNNISSPIEGGTIPENESATALFEWKVPKATGNEIQGDAVEFDVDFVLKDENS
jgi:hypothetical protein